MLLHSYCVGPLYLGSNCIIMMWLVLIPYLAIYPVPRENGLDSNLSHSYYWLTFMSRLLRHSEGDY